MRRTCGAATAVAAVLTAAACGSTPAAPPATTASPVPTQETTTQTTTPTAAPTAAPIGAPTSGQASGGAIGNCATAELRGSVGPDDGAAGSVYVVLTLANTGGRTCELRGFPGVSYVTGDDGHQVGPAAAMGGQRGGEVVLKPGARASTPLQLVDVAAFDPAVCRPTPVRGLRVYPPGDTTSLFVERPGTGCAGSPPGDQLSVQTLEPA